MTDSSAAEESLPAPSELSPRSVQNGQTDDSDNNDTVDSEITEYESRVYVSLGALCVETQGDTLDEAETSFYRVWGHIMDDMDEMTDAMRERLGGYQ